VLFHYWAAGVIDETATPRLNSLVQLLIACVRLFTGSKKLVNRELFRVTHHARAV
jgi:hypothetical protein